MAYTTITDPSAYFQISTYDGNGSDDRNITYDGNSNMQPDFLWFKRRNQAVNHILFDSTRGVTSRIHSNNSNAAAIEANFLQAFNSDGFQVGTDADINGSGGTFVSWGWKATGGTTSSNTDGTITSTIQANTTAGFSIVSYSGNGVNGATVGHGLGAQPEIIFIKRTNVNASGGGSNWPVRSTLLTAQQVMYLDLTDAAGNSTTMFNNTYPNTTTFTIGDNEATNAYQTNHSFTGTYIAYCFTSIKGFSKMGSYTGNGNSDGTFIYTGFKPRFIMIKGTGNVSSWNMYDTKRDPINRASQQIKANSDAVEASTGAMDFLSNGIKMRTTDNDFNGNGNSYIYMAFAENPFVATNGVPATAR